MATTCTVCELHAESVFKVEGMDCRDEVVLIERRFKHLRGVEAFTADVIGQRLLVKYDAAKLSAAAIVGAGRRWYRRADLPAHQLARLKLEQAKAAVGASGGAWRVAEQEKYSPASRAESMS